MKRAPKRPSANELKVQVDNLQSEVTRFIVIKQQLIDTQGLLDRERNRFQGIQACSEKLLRAEDMDTFTVVLLESILQTFEFEVSLFAKFDDGRQRLDVIGQAGFDTFPASLPFNIDWLEGNTGVILPSGHELLEKWNSLGLGEAVICPFVSEKDNSFAGLVIGGLTTENLGLYDPINAEVISSFSVMVTQAIALLRNFELKRKLQEQNVQLEHYSKNLELIVEERTRELRLTNRELAAAYRQNLGHLRATEKELDYQELLAQTDELTGLHNRRYMDEQLEKLVQRPKQNFGQFGLLILDLDGFKSINDTYGHPCGDSVLKAVAEILRMSCRHTDLACRLGGDEFAVIMPGITSIRGKQVAEQVRSQIETLTGIDQKLDIQLSASLGGTIHATAESLGDLISRVDKNLYQAKRNGRNRVVWK